MFSPSPLHLPLLGASKGISELEEEKITPTKGPEQVTAECREERCREKNEDDHGPHMDYILVNHEENSPAKPETCEARENTSEFEEFHTGSEEAEVSGTQLAGFPDSCQLVSSDERRDHSAERRSPQSDRRSSPESPGQDQTWMVVGHREVADQSSEDRNSGPGGADKDAESTSDGGLGEGPQIQVLGGMKPLESLALEEASGLGSQSRKSKRRCEADPDAVMMQAVTHDNEWEMLSPQPSQKNTILETEMEEETEFLEPRTRTPRRNG